MGKWCLHASSFIFDQIIIKVAGSQGRHKSSVKFNFGPSQTTHFVVTCPWVKKISHFWTWISLKPVGQSWSNLCVASLGWGKGSIMFWGRLDQNTGFHGNRNLPLTYNGENDVSTFSRLFLTRSFLARLYESTGRAIAVTTASASASTSASALAALLKTLKFLVKVFTSLYLTIRGWI